MLIADDAAIPIRLHQGGGQDLARRVQPLVVAVGRRLADRADRRDVQERERDEMDDTARARCRASSCCATRSTAPARPIRQDPGALKATDLKRISSSWATRRQVRRQGPEHPRRGSSSAAGRRELRHGLAQANAEKAPVSPYKGCEIGGQMFRPHCFRCIAISETSPASLTGKT